MCFKWRLRVNQHDNEHHNKQHNNMDNSSMGGLLQNHSTGLWWLKMRILLFAKILGQQW